MKKIRLIRMNDAVTLHHPEDGPTLGAAMPTAPFDLFAPTPHIELDAPPARILIIKPSAIGDVVHALPVLYLLRKRWPAAQISWLITPACASLLQGHPMIDELILFDRKRYGKFWHSPAALMAMMRFFIGLRRRRFDLVIDLQGLLRSGLLCWLTRANRRIGLASAREGATAFYTHQVRCDWGNEHAVTRYLRIAAALGCNSADIHFPLPIDESDARHIDSLIPPGTRYAVMLPGANWLTKRWPAEYFARLVQPLREQLGIECVVAGAAADSALAQQINARYDLTGKTTLRQMVPLIKNAAVVIANDTGPMHIAAALGVPLATPYGPTSPTRTGPFSREKSVIRVLMPCMPCYSRTCSHNSCMKWLEPEQVMKVVEEEISRALFRR